MIKNYERWFSSNYFFHAVKNMLRRMRPASSAHREGPRRSAKASHESDPPKSVAKALLEGASRRCSRKALQEFAPERRLAKVLGETAEEWRKHSLTGAPRRRCAKLLREGAWRRRPANAHWIGAAGCIFSNFPWSSRRNFWAVRQLPNHSKIEFRICSDCLKSSKFRKVDDMRSQVKKCGEN